MQIGNRKAEHVNIVLEKDIDSRAFGSLFDSIKLKYYALPESNFDEVDFSTSFLGKKLRAPLMVTSMTGGFDGAEKINLDLAKACEEEGIIFALGSQRAMIQNENLTQTFQVRSVAPTALICGNVGAFQLKKIPFEKIENAARVVGADAICLHLNPLQEVMQPEGDRDWSGVLPLIKKFVSNCSLPVIAKEVGAGICEEIAFELQDAGVSALDVSAKGGSNWAKVELHRNQNWDVKESALTDLGVPLEGCFSYFKKLKIPVIASGGVRSGVDAAKCIAMGAKIVGAARPFLLHQNAGGSDGVKQLIQKWKFELKVSMFTSRSKTLSDLNEEKIV